MTSPASTTWLQNNGTWHPGASLSATDRGIRYGMSVFETIGIQDGAPLFLDDHLSVFHESARTLFNNPSLPQIQELPALSPDATGVLRIYITAGDGSPTAPINTPRIFALFDPLLEPHLPASQSARIHPNPIIPFGAGLKTANYWLQCSAQSAAHQAGFDHAILIGHDASVLSAAFGNIFYVIDGILHTPPLTLPIRPGIIRSWVARQLDVVETTISTKQLLSASEIFITNSRLGVLPLSLATITPGPVGTALRDAARDEKIFPCPRNF